MTSARKLARTALQVVGLYRTYTRLRAASRKRREWRDWNNKGRPAPPPHAFKEQVVLQYAANYQLDTFVETGTYVGLMIEAVTRSFRRIYSIELSEELYSKAREKFASFKKVRLFLGDSADILPEVVRQLTGPALFWLDAHYSEGMTARGDVDTPIMREIQCVLGQSSARHVVLIDDARSFGTDPAYPSLEKLGDQILQMRPRATILVQDDIIRVVSQ